MLQTIKDYYEAPADQAGVELNVDAPSSLQAALDRSLMQRAIGNLVSNALAHTPPSGHIHLSAADSSTGLEISVSDDGCGVPPEAIERLFDRFYRVDPARSQQSGGFGLGLSIVRGIMLLHRRQCADRERIGQRDAGDPADTDIMSQNRALRGCRSCD